MKINIDESKILEFKMDVSGCSWKELEGYFRFDINDIEYGFPITIDEDMVKVNIPIINNILNENIKTSLYEQKKITVNARLDLIANNDTYIRPWNENIEIEIPVFVKIIEQKDSFVKKQIVVVDSIEEKKEKKTNKKNKSKMFNKLSINENKDKDKNNKKILKNSNFSKIFT